MKPSELRTFHTSRSRRNTDTTFDAETARELYKPIVSLDECELIMRVKLNPLLVIKMKQRHCLFNQNLNLDNDYLLLLLIILILDGISKHLKELLLYR